VRVAGVPGLAFTDSRPIGGVWLLDGLWRQLRIDTLLGRLAAGTRRHPIVERVMFTLVANRALAPSSKLAATSLLAGDVHVTGIEATTDDACYRAMDWLVQVQDQIGLDVVAADTVPQGSLTLFNIGLARPVSLPLKRSTPRCCRTTEPGEVQRWGSPR